MQEWGDALIFNIFLLIEMSTSIICPLNPSDVEFLIMIGVGSFFITTALTEELPIKQIRRSY